MADRLQVLITGSSLTYTFFNKHSGFSLPAEKSYNSTEEFSGALTTLKTDKEGIETSIFGIVNSDFTLVPFGLIEPGNRSTLINFSKKTKKDGPIRADFISAINAENIYQLPSELINAIENHFSNIKVIHNTSVFIETAIRTDPGFEKPVIYLWVNKSGFDVLVCEKGKLTYQNTFNSIVPEDVLYYLTFICDKLPIDRINTRLITGGFRQGQSQLYKLLNLYFREIKPIEQLNHNVKTAEYSKYFTLYNQHLCAL